MRIVESTHNEDVLFVKYDKTDDSIGLEGEDWLVWLTPIEAQQLADALQRTCNKTQYFQGLRSKCS